MKEGSHELQIAEASISQPGSVGSLQTFYEPLVSVQTATFSCALQGIINLLTWTFRLVFIWYSCVLLGETSDFKAILAGIQLFYMINMYVYGGEEMTFPNLVSLLPRAACFVSEGSVVTLPQVWLIPKISYLPL